MSRPSKILQALERARLPASASDPLDDPRIARLAERFSELRREAFRNLVDRGIELGEILLEARPLLKGHYHRWLEERLEVQDGTARNYVALAALAHQEPGVIQRWKELGPSKLYRLARISPGGRREVLRAEGLREMTDFEFSALTRRHVLSVRKVTGNMRAHGLRMKVRSFAKLLEGTRLPRIEDAAMRAGLRDDLLELGRRARSLAASL
jgi:hypothetical protein